MPGAIRGSIFLLVAGACRVDDAGAQTARRVLAGGVRPRIRIGGLRQYSAHRACAEARGLRLGLSRLCRRLRRLDDLVRLVGGRRAGQSIPGGAFRGRVGARWMARRAGLRHQLCVHAGGPRLASGCEPVQDRPRSPPRLPSRNPRTSAQTDSPTDMPIVDDIAGLRRILAAIADDRGRRSCRPTGTGRATSRRSTCRTTDTGSFPSTRPTTRCSASAAIRRSPRFPVRSTWSTAFASPEEIPASRARPSPKARRCCGCSSASATTRRRASRTTPASTWCMDRCVKIEHARILGGLHWAGVNTGVISSGGR